jgi:glycosyltransferase involved in cell wall biosynthesis
MTKIAVVLPVYKADSPLLFDLAVKSILNQTVECHLFICQDGLLTNELNKLCDTYPKDRVSIIPYKENKGLPTVLNRGIRIALKQGFKYIARMDADDLSMKDRLGVQSDYLDKNTQIDVLGSNAILINEKGSNIGVKKVKEVVRFQDLKFNCDMIHPSVMFKSDFFQKFGFYNESLLKSQDYELWLRASKNGAVLRNLDQNLMYFRYESNLVGRRKKEQWYNISIKFKYLSLFEFIPGIIRHIFILICPERILKWLLNKTQING